MTVTIESSFHFWALNFNFKNFNFIFKNVELTNKGNYRCEWVWKRFSSGSYFSVLYFFLVSILDIFYERVPFYFLLCQILTIYQNQERGKKRQEKKLRRKVESGKCLTVVLYIIFLCCTLLEGWRKQKKE